MARAIFLLSLFALCCDSTLYAKDRPWDDSKTIEAPFTLRNGAVILEVRIKDKGPFNMALATGSYHSTVDWIVKEDLKYQLYFNIDPFSGKQVNFVQASGMQIGDLKVNTLNMRLGQLEIYGREMGIQIHGILGYDFLKGRVVRIDYNKKVIQFLPKEFNKKDQKASGASSSSSAVTLQMELTREAPAPVVKDVLINGMNFKAMLDTWQNLPLSLTPAAIERLGLPAVGEKSAPRIGEVESLQVGAHKQDKPRSAHFGKGSGLDHGLNRYGAIIGAGFLSKYVVIFDYANNLFILE